LELIQSSDAVLPEWAALEFHQCQHCPLDPIEVEACPVAINLVPFIHLCGNLDSYQHVDVDVQTNERLYSIRNTTTQRAFSSLLGLIIATSGCQHAVFFKPMARFHLPLANEQETLFRAVSNYLLMQYFNNKTGKNVDLDLHGLEDIYNNIERVNFSIAKRLQVAARKDTAVNSIVLLDLFAKVIPYSIEDALQELTHLYKSLLDTKKS